MATEEVGGDVIAQFPRLVRIEVRQNEDAEPILWVTLNAAGESFNASSLVVEQPYPQ